MLCNDKYKCECGLSFPRSQDKASHCKHCKIHLAQKVDQRRMLDGVLDDGGSFGLMLMGRDPVTATSLVARASIAPLLAGSTYSPAASGYPTPSALLGLARIGFPGAASAYATATRATPASVPLSPPSAHAAGYDLGVLAAAAAADTPRSVLPPFTGTGATTASTAAATPFRLYDPGPASKRHKPERLEADAFLTCLGTGRYRSIVVLVGPDASIDSSPSSSSASPLLNPELGATAQQARRAEGFTVREFLKDPAPLYRFCRDLFLGTVHPTTAHFFLKVLYEKGVLQRVYTQNFDDLERTAGIPDKLLVQLRGNLRTARCSRPECAAMCPIEPFAKRVCTNEVPMCPLCAFPVRPDVVFNDEKPRLDLYEALEADLLRCDLLLVLGSLPAELPTFASRVSAPRVFVTTSCPAAPAAAAAPASDDLEFSSSCLDEVAKIVYRVGWHATFVEQQRRYKEYCIRQSLPVPSAAAAAFSEGTLVTVTASAASGAKPRDGKVLEIIETANLPLYHVVFLDCGPGHDAIVSGDRMTATGQSQNQQQQPQEQQCALAPTSMQAESSTESKRMSIGFLTV